jgi:hypothetical protein
VWTETPGDVWLSIPCVNESALLVSVLTTMFGGSPQNALRDGGGRKHQTKLGGEDVTVVALSTFMNCHLLDQVSLLMTRRSTPVPAAPSLPPTQANLTS